MKPAGTGRRRRPRCPVTTEQRDTAGPPQPTARISIGAAGSGTSAASATHARAAVLQQFQATLAEEATAGRVDAALAQHLRDLARQAQDCLTFANPNKACGPLNNLAEKITASSVRSET
ncbi:hypothetical protein GCM10022255_094640 [Dactylosporangium darangshiense]|uniref:Transposase IS204/IS1001/IS1096/IS1165 DDE domain-containing protein n=1 Tax=Dactylosporangium darangshiense TaxID=579108 RepID=A0ABP8DQN0_9ACTN